jgi:putative endonuclease
MIYPVRWTMMNKLYKYYYVYTLQSVKDGLFYTGYTNNLKNRIQEHFDGRVVSTKNRLPMKIVYWEGCLNQQDATRREKYFKSAWGKRYLKNRIANYLMG